MDQKERQLLARYLGLFQQADLRGFPHSLFGSTLKGNFQGREVEIGIYFSRQVSGVFVRFKLENPPPLPIYVWDRCPLGTDAGTGLPKVNNLGIYARRWLNYESYFSPPHGRAVKYLQLLTPEKMKEILEKMTVIAQKVDHGEISLEKPLARMRRNLLDEAKWILIIGGSFSAFIYYWVFIHK